MSTPALGDTAVGHVRHGLIEASENLPNMPLLGFVCGAVFSLGLWIVLGWVAYHLLA